MDNSKSRVASPAKLFEGVQRFIASAQAEAARVKV
jgi:hypothetical protein